MSVTKSQFAVDKTEDRHENCQLRVAIPAEMLKEVFYYTETHPTQQIITHTMFGMLERITELERTIVKLNAKIDKLNEDRSIPCD